MCLVVVVVTYVGPSYPENCIGKLLSSSLDFRQGIGEFGLWRNLKSTRPFQTLGCQEHQCTLSHSRPSLPPSVPPPGLVGPRSPPLPPSVLSTASTPSRLKAASRRNRTQGEFPDLRPLGRSQGGSTGKGFFAFNSECTVRRVQRTLRRRCMAATIAEEVEAKATEPQDSREGLAALGGKDGQSRGLILHSCNLELCIGCSCRGERPWLWELLPRPRAQSRSRSVALGPCGDGLQAWEIVHSVPINP